LKEEANKKEHGTFPPAGSCGVAKERMENKDEMHCYDWFFCTKKLDKEKVLKAVLKK
jgi:peroxiredoxin (alkyl hydroperoxide reductase subunit C)